jgi:hypothetical protein
LVPLAPNLKIVIERFWRRAPLGLYRGYLGERWPGLEKCKKALKTPLRTLCHNLDLSLRKVANPPSQLEEFGLAVAPVAIPNPLNSTLYPRMNLMNHRFPLL